MLLIEVCRLNQGCDFDLNLENWFFSDSYTIKFIIWKDMTANILIYNEQYLQYIQCPSVLFSTI